MTHFYILYTDMFSEVSPLLSGEDRQPQDLQILGDDALAFDIGQWESIYKACDTLDILSGPGEACGHYETNAVGSDLSLLGRSLCARIEASTGVPTYYFLTIGTEEPQAGDPARSCPSCGQPWRLTDSPHPLSDFKCEPCRLTSTWQSAIAFP